VQFAAPAFSGLCSLFVLIKVSSSATEVALDIRSLFIDPAHDCSRASEPLEVHSLDRALVLAPRQLPWCEDVDHLNEALGVA